MQRLVAFLLFILAFNIAAAFGQNPQNSAEKMWREIDDTILQRNQLQRTIIPAQYKTFSLNQTELKNLLQNAPMEFTEAARTGSLTISLPMPDGSFARFSVQESKLMEPGLAARFPNIKTYHGQGIDDPTATVRFGTSPEGFNSMISSSKGTYLIDRYAVGNNENYISYAKETVQRSGEFFCDVRNDVAELTKLSRFEILPDATNVVSGTNLRTYRLAVATTGEYTNVFRQSGDTDAQARVRALSQIVLIMNRVNGVYEKEVAIRMVLIDRQDSIIYTNPATDPYTNENGQVMLNENQNNLTSVIGSAAYDIGHVFSTGGGGIAQLQSPCGTGKARGVTGLPNPVGDPFAIDYVAHEMGHQFGGNHTFNVGVGSCGAQRAGNASYEPGSGVTIMGYAGICGNQNLAFNSIDTFHVKSIEEIVAFSTGTGNSCSVPTATGNTPPTVAGATGSTIPKLTPFTLSATATDAENDSLTFDWQEYDLGAPATTPAGNSDSDGQERPLFRPFLPVTGGTRTFPRLQYILNNANVPPTTSGSVLVGEVLPSISRTMLFQVIVRDNRANGGGIRTRAAIVAVDGTAGPFVITAPETAVNWTGNTQQTVTWNVANTNAGTVNAANVKISLSTDGGQTFPTVLSASTANDGSETITVPNTVTTSQARIKVEAVDNIFFDISGVNFSIAPGVQNNRKPFDFDGDGKADVSVFRPENGSWYIQQSTAGFTGLAFGLGTDKLAPADFDGDGKTDVAVVRNGTWYLQRSQAGFTGIAFGDGNDIPVPADFDGDGKAEIAVFRPSNGYWYILNLVNNQFTATLFGINGDKPVAADYDGDGKADITVNRSGNWYIQRSQLGFTGILFGDANDKLVPADYDGDGKADVAVFRPSNGSWYIQQSQAGFTGTAFGLGTDIPVAADYDGDGKADIAVVRNGNWYIQRTQAGFTGVLFGTSTDKPIPNSFVR